MKSYYTHLKSTMEFGEENTITRKPISIGLDFKS